jgi:hypothetical protein
MKRLDIRHRTGVQKQLAAGTRVVMSDVDLGMDKEEGEPRNR